MASPSLPVLQKLHYLDRSLSEFHHQLINVLYGEEYARCVKGIQGDDLRWLVDYLDEVGRHIARPYFLLESGQVFDVLPPFSAASRKCLRELRSICGNMTMLPTSYTLSSGLIIDPEPFNAGGFGDVYRGTLNGSPVCAKRVRMYVEHDQKESAKVCFRRHYFHCPS